MSWIFSTILNWLGGGVLDKVLGHLEARANSETERQRIKALPPDKEKRLEETVEGGMRNATTIKHELEYADLCVE